MNPSLTLWLLIGVTCLNVMAAGLVRRDVSHLPLEYLPPVILPPLPSREYLPPVEQHAASLTHVVTPPRDYLPPTVEQPQPQQLKLNNEYLPPPAELQQLSTEQPTTESITELPSTTPLPPATTLQAEFEAEAETVAPTAETAKTHEHIELEAGTLQQDGYHYNAPDVIPDLFSAPAPAPPAPPAVEAYLPPLDDNTVVAEQLPESDETAALLDDGYHYRAIRRLRF